MPRSNFHTHSLFCDGADSPEELVQQAMLLGMTKLGFSGHMDPCVSMDLPVYVREIRRLEKAYRDRLEIFCGVEVDYYSEPFDRTGLDYVIGSTHMLGQDGMPPVPIDYTAQMTWELCRERYGGDGYRMAKAYYELEAEIAEKTGCTFIGHFDLIARFNEELHMFDENDPRYLGPALEAMEVLVKRGLPFEVNAGAVNRNRKTDFYPNRNLLKQLQSFGGKILLSSDAHSKNLLLGALSEAERVAAECGFTHALELCRMPDGAIGWEEVPFSEKLIAR